MIEVGKISDFNKWPKEEYDNTGNEIKVGLVRRIASSLSTNLINNSNNNNNNNSNNNSDNKNQYTSKTSLNSGGLNRSSSSISSSNIKTVTNNSNFISSKVADLKNHFSLKSNNQAAFIRGNCERKSLDEKCFLKKPNLINTNIKTCIEKVKQNIIHNKSIADTNPKNFFHLEETNKGIQIQITQPHLVSVTKYSLNTYKDSQNSNNEHDTKQLSKTSIKIYPLNFGKTRIGSNLSNDIVINSPDIEPEQCYIETFLTNNKNCNNKVILFPIGKLCAVDGVVISTPYTLHSGKLSFSSLLTKSNYLKRKSIKVNIFYRVFLLLNLVK